MKKLTLITIMLMSIQNVFSQQQLTLYNMDILGQSSLVNPSLIPANGIFIGIPALSNMNIMFTNSGFTWRDLHKVRADDSVSIDIENAISKLKSKNFISLGIRESILEAGFKVKKTYFNLNVAERANLNFTFPKELFELIFKGNAAFVGQEVDLSSLAFDATHFREYGIGFARKISGKTTIGARVKYLYGMENFSSAKSHFSFFTAPDDYRLELNSEFTINTSMTGNNTDGNSGDYMFGMKNTGWGTDLSATYDVSPKWKINGSIIDLGFITWKSNVKNMVTAAGTYSFEGVDIADFMSDSSSSMDHITDSLSDAFTPVENSDPYTTKLPTHYFFNATYKISERTSTSGLVHAQSYRGSVQPSFTLSLNSRLTYHVSAVLSYSIINHHFDNIGGGLVMHAGAFQFFVISDNWIGTINPLSNHTSHVNFGFNLVFQRPKKKIESTIPKVTAIPAEFTK